MEKNDQNLELILLDKCTIQSLGNDELEIISKHKILVPDIFLIENFKRKETLNKINKLKNIYWVRHWGLLAKDALLGQGITVTPEDLTKITDDPEELKNQTKLAKKIAKHYDDFPKKLLQKSVDLSPKSSRERIMKRVISECKRLYPSIEITDNIIKVAETELKQRESLFSIEHDDWAKLSRIVLNDLNNKPIREENRHLKEDQRTYIRNKEWLDLACECFQAGAEEKIKIFNRWEETPLKNLKYFASYAYYILALQLTMVLHITKSKGSYKREIMRDMGYLYYANCSNVTFHTCDRKLKDTIQKISFLKHVQDKMVYFYNDEVDRPGELNRPDWLKILKDSVITTN